MNALLLALSLLAASTPYVETFEVRIQSLEVIVSDRDGKPVRGLTKDDFLVLEEGAAQEISNFSAYDESAGTATTGPAPNNATSVAAPAPPPRKVVFFLDELSLHPASRTKLVRNAMQFVEAMGEHDRTMVITAIGPRNVVQEWTNDRAAIRRALEQSMATAYARVDTQAANELRYIENQARLGLTRTERRNIRQRYASMVKRRVEQRLGGLRALVASMAGIEGKKVLVVITSSLTAMPGYEQAVKEREELIGSFASSIGEGAAGSAVSPEAGLSTIVPIVYDLRPLIEDLGRTAAASGVTIYPLQPDVPLDLITPGTAERRGNGALITAAPYGAALENTQMTMTALAETTGGRWFRGDGRIDDAFRQIEADVRTYYSLGYRPKGDKDRARRIEVRVKNRPDVTVRTRRDVIEKSTGREMSDLTKATLLYTHPVNELAVTATTGTPQRIRDAFSIPIEVGIPMEKLTFLPSGEGRYSAHLRIHYAASGEKSDFVAGEDREQRIDIDEPQLRALAGKVFRYTSNLLITRASYRIAIGVLDETSRLSGFQTVTVKP